MIPTSLGGLLAFLASVGPGYAFVRVRERWTPPVERTPLREAAQIVVAGSLASLLGIVTALDVGQWLGFIDPAAFAASPETYFVTHLIGGTVALLVVLTVSYGAAALGAWLTPGKGARVFTDSGWYTAFERRLPHGHGVRATVELRDGRKIAGVIREFTADATPIDHRELTLSKSSIAAMKVWTPQSSHPAELAEEFIVLRGSDIAYIAASFFPAAKS